MTSVQLEVPDDIYRRLVHHPDCPGWRGRRKWILQLLIDVTNSPGFRVKELEEENRRVRRDRDQKAKDAEFWQTRAGGLTALFRTTPTATSDSGTPNAA